MEKVIDFYILLKIWAKIRYNISKNFSGKYSPKFLDHTKKFAIDALKTTSKRVIQKTAASTDDLNCNKIAHRITKVSKNSQQNNSEAVTNNRDKEVPKVLNLQKKGRIPYTSLIIQY